MFVGTDCPHCNTMRPLVAKLGFEEGLIIQERDVWKNERDARLLENYQSEVMKNDPECDGIPFFYNTRNATYLCGEVSYKSLKAWALDK